MFMPLAGLGRRGFSRFKRFAPPGLRFTPPGLVKRYATRPGELKPPTPGGFRRRPMPAFLRRVPEGLQGMPTKSGVELLSWVKENEPRAWAAIVKRVPAAALAVQKAG